MTRPLFLGIAIHATFLISRCHPFTANHNRGNPHRAASSSSFPPSSSSSFPLHLRSQVLDFVEPTTGVRVKLIGAMHYNPASIKLATDSINALAAEGRLGSIIIESCDIRWNATLQSELARDALLSEMKAAYDLGLMHNRPVVLGDQRINVTVAQLKGGLRETALDLLQPWNGGWVRLADVISSAREVAVPTGDKFLGLGSFFDPTLLASAPVSFVKYPLSYFVRSPAFAITVGALVLLGGVDSSDAYVADAASARDILGSVLLSVLETVVFARIFLKELLAERNEILAANIVSLWDIKWSFGTMYASSQFTNHSRPSFPPTSPSMPSSSNAVTTMRKTAVVDGSAIYSRIGMWINLPARFTRRVA